MADEVSSKEPLKLVYGGGFEAEPDLLTNPNGRWELAGNRPEIVRLVKNPFVLAEVCRDLGILTPETARANPPGGDGWLQKRIGGAGGGHIRRVLVQPARDGAYYQREITGRAVSALFIGDGGATGVVGYSEQWVAATFDQPFRYGGAAQPASLTATQMQAVDRAVRGLAQYFRLRGLNSADFMVDGSNVWLLEINPRPGATLELFDNDVNKLFDQHLRPAGRIWQWEPKHFHVDYASASAVVYADRGDLIAPAIPEPPNWLKDRPQPGTKIRRNQPLCTVLANGETLSQCIQVCAERGLFAQSLYYNK